jgi:hypothetical protein
MASPGWRVVDAEAGTNFIVVSGGLSSTNQNSRRTPD